VVTDEKLTEFKVNGKMRISKGIEGIVFSSVL
jgi:hypothetical protein